MSKQEVALCLDTLSMWNDAGEARAVQTDVRVKPC